VDVVASLSQGLTAAAQCGLFTYKSVPVIFEPPCICPSAWEKLLHTERIFMKIDIRVFFINVSRTYKAYLNMARITGMLYENLCYFVIHR